MALEKMPRELVEWLARNVFVEEFADGIVFTGRCIIICGNWDAGTGVNITCGGW